MIPNLSFDIEGSTPRDDIQLAHCQKFGSYVDLPLKWLKLNKGSMSYKLLNIYVIKIDIFKVIAI